jgi:hypothetical protein
LRIGRFDDSKYNGDEEGHDHTYHPNHNKDGIQIFFVGYTDKPAYECN